jgi:hypothetical protein
MRLRQPHRHHDKPNGNSYGDSYRLNVVPSLVVPKQVTHLRVPLWANSSPSRLGSSCVSNRSVRWSYWGRLLGNTPAILPYALSHLSTTMATPRPTVATAARSRADHAFQSLRKSNIGHPSLFACHHLS